MPDRWWRVVGLALLLQAPAAAAQAPDSAFIAWARSRAVSIGQPTEPIPGLNALARSARVIGVGESVHNVRQFLELRARILQQLVEQGGVTALVLESGLPEGRLIDDYVAGRADTVDFGAALTYGLGAYHEARQPIRWLRGWNLGRGRGRPVRVVGIDLPASAGSLLPALDPVLAILARVDSGESARLRQVLRPLAARVAGAHALRAVAQYGGLSLAEQATLRLEVSRLTSRVTLRRAVIIRAVGLTEYDWAVRLAEIVRQTETMLRLGAYHASNPRDQAMAANTLWVLGKQPPSGKVLLWAHNAHVQQVPIAGPASPAKQPVPTIGSILHGRLGVGYLAIGTSYGGPSLDSATTPDPTGVDRALGAVGTPPIFLDLTRSPKAGPAHRWLAEPRPIRFQVGHLLIPLAAAFDAVVYFDRVERAVGKQ